MRIPDFRRLGTLAALGLVLACAGRPDAEGRGSTAGDAGSEEAAAEAEVPLAPLLPLAERVRDPDVLQRVEAASLALLPVEAWPVTLRVPLRLRIEWKGGSAAHEVLLERAPGTLVLRERAKAPAGPAGFRLAIVTGPATSGTRETVEVEPGALAALPFAPAHLLADVQRAYYPWLLGVPECGPCERSGWRGDVAIWERIGPERIRARRLARAALLPYGSVGVRYSQRTVFGMPAIVALENTWIGYRLVFEALDPAAVGAAGAPAEAADPAPTGAGGGPAGPKR